jgi:carbonic anhydrase
MNRMIRWAAAFLAFATTTSLVAQRTPDEALRALQEGNRRFAADKSIAQPLGEGVRRTLARGQSPFAIVLCCADSRVPPELIFNAGLGELFVVRVAGHTCDPETLASIEYAVDHLNTSLCVVLGHESCGAVAATVGQIEAQQHEHPEPAESHAIQQLLEQIEPAVRKVQVRDLGGKDLTDAAEEEHAQLTATECLRRSPLLRRFAQVGKFKMVAARYHLQSGEVEWLPNRPLPRGTGLGGVGRARIAHRTVPMGGAAARGPAHAAGRPPALPRGRCCRPGTCRGTRREQLTHGQRPLAIVLTCADSRVAPEHVFDAGLGELFVIRVAGNALNDDVLASIEYAASHTGASLLVVMGHTRCGAVTAAAGAPGRAPAVQHSPCESLLAQHSNRRWRRCVRSGADRRRSRGTGDPRQRAARGRGSAFAQCDPARAGRRRALRDAARPSTTSPPATSTWLKDAGEANAQCRRSDRRARRRAGWRDEPRQGPRSTRRGPEWARGAGCRSTARTHERPTNTVRLRRARLVQFPRR